MTIKGEKVEIRIEPMRREDLDRVMEIEEICFSSPWSRWMFLSEISDNPFSTSLVARNLSGRVVAYICFWIVFDEVHLMNLAVHPSERRRDIAQELLRIALEKGKRQGARVATLEVRRSNEAAKRLYERNGFALVSVRRNYYADPKEDALLFGKSLTVSGQMKEVDYGR